MEPQARCVLHVTISERSHMFYQLLVSNDTSLFEAIHALLNTHVDPPLVIYQQWEVIDIIDLLWDNFQGNENEFRVW